MIFPSAARVYTLDAELETERARLGQLESELESTRAGARALEDLKEGTARESEEIVGALQGQVDAANKVSRWSLVISRYSLGLVVIHPSPVGWC